MTIPFIHQTDLFHPYGDPDDHWDLATVYALAAMDRLFLQGIVCDYPPNHREGDPATLAAAQLSYYSGITGVPLVIGSMYPMKSRMDDQREMPAINQTAAEWILEILTDSDRPVVINIVGSATDVAIAGVRRPDLFESKCKAIYLNAGAAYHDDDSEIEYNVMLDPIAYAVIFDLPCPIYWCPCWHRTERQEVGPHGTWYSFRQGDILPHLSKPLQNYFLYMLSRSNDPKWLRHLFGPVDAGLLTKVCQEPRNMWSTAGIFHAAGLCVDGQGRVMATDQANDSVFDFMQASIRCDNQGKTTWESANHDTRRYIFCINDTERYPSAMTTALRSLLMEL